MHRKAVEQHTPHYRHLIRVRTSPAHFHSSYRLDTLFDSQQRTENCQHIHRIHSFFHIP